MSNGLLLWVDDEIELLKAHIIFLEKKGYEVITVSNGSDAIDQCSQQTFDLVLLDEQMPGLSGLETLQRIKEIQPATPIVMVTKSEEENIMDRLEDCRLSDKARKPESDSLDSQKEHPSQGNRYGSNADGLSAGFHGNLDADTGLPHFR